MWRAHRWVTNRVGIVHAIARCSLVALVDDPLTGAAAPADTRWTPNGLRLT